MSGPCMFVTHMRLLRFISLVHMQAAKIALSALTQLLRLLTEQQPATQPTRLCNPTAYPRLHPLSLIHPLCQILSHQKPQQQWSGALRQPRGMAWMSLQLSRQETVPHENAPTKQSHSTPTGVACFALCFMQAVKAFRVCVLAHGAVGGGIHALQQCDTQPGMHRPA